MNVEIILDFLRDREVNLDAYNYNEAQLKMLEEDLDFFQITDFPLYDP